MMMSFIMDNYELFNKILKIIRKCDSEDGNLYAEEGADLIMKEIEKWYINLIKGKE